MVYLFVLIIVFFMFMSARQFLQFKAGTKSKLFSMISLEIFYSILIIYLIYVIGFGLIYFILSFTNEILIENYDGKVVQPSVLAQLFKSMYFSGVTFLTIGYGDITPNGIGRLIAMIQALIGYILPTAFVYKLIQLRERSH